MTPSTSLVLGEASISATIASSLRSRAEERPVQHRVDTERGAGEAQDLEDAPCRRAGAEEVKRAGHQFIARQRGKAPPTWP